MWFMYAQALPQPTNIHPLLCFLYEIPIHNKTAMNDCDNWIVAAWLQIWLSYDVSSCFWLLLFVCRVKKLYIITTRSCSCYYDQSFEKYAKWSHRISRHEGPCAVTLNIMSSMDMCRKSKLPYCMANIFIIIDFWRKWNHKGVYKTW